VGGNTKTKVRKKVTAVASSREVTNPGQDVGIAWTGSEAATFDGTHVTADGTMATYKVHEANGPSKLDYKSPYTMAMTPIAGSPPSKGQSPLNPQEQIGDNDEVINKDATVYEYNTTDLNGRCLSGAIPDYIFVCQNWY